MRELFEGLKFDVRTSREPSSGFSACGAAAAESAIVLNEFIALNELNADPLSFNFMQPQHDGVFSAACTGPNLAEALRTLGIEADINSTSPVWLNSAQVLELWQRRGGSDVSVTDVCTLDEGLIRMCRDYAKARDDETGMKEPRVLILNTDRAGSRGNHWFACCYYIKTERSPAPKKSTKRRRTEPPSQ